MTTATEATQTPQPPPRPTPPRPVAAPPFTGYEGLTQVARYVAARLNAIDSNPDGTPRWFAGYGEVERRLPPAPGAATGLALFRAEVKATEAEGVAFMVVLPSERITLAGFPGPSDVRLKVKPDGSANWARLAEAATLFVTRREEARVRRGHEKARGARVQALREAALREALDAMPAWRVAEGMTPDRTWHAGSTTLTLKWNWPDHPLFAVRVQARRVDCIPLTDTRSDAEIVAALKVDVEVGGGVVRPLTLRDASRVVRAMHAAVEHFNATAVEP